MKKAKTAQASPERSQPEYRCSCGGKVKMVTQFHNGIKHFARCEKCGCKERRLSDFPCIPLA